MKSVIFPPKWQTQCKRHRFLFSLMKKRLSILSLAVSNESNCDTLLFRQAIFGFCVNCSFVFIYIYICACVTLQNCFINEHQFATANSFFFTNSSLFKWRDLHRSRNRTADFLFFFFFILHFSLMHMRWHFRWNRAIYCST